jgi:hypothetical protein
MAQVRKNRGNLLSWFAPTGTNNDLATGGVTPDCESSYLLATSGDTIRFYVNVPLPTASYTVALYRSDNTASGVSGLLTTEAIDLPSGVVTNAYGSVTIPSNFAIGTYYLRLTVGGAVWTSTPIAVVDAAFAASQTQLFSFRNRYSMDGIYYPHLSNATFRQQFRLLCRRQQVEGFISQEEYRRSDGTLYTTNNIKATRHRISFSRVDPYLAEGLLGLTMHDDIEINGRPYVAVGGISPGEYSYGGLSEGAILFEDKTTAWAQTCSNLLTTL